MEELIIRSKNGDEEAFTELILRIQNDLYRIGKTRLNDDNDIGDAIQETMINAYKNLGKLKDNLKFKGWIIKILINECNKIYKKKSRKISIIKKFLENQPSDINENFTRISDSNIDFEILIENLKYEEKLIVTLYYNSQYSCQEISDILNMNINTVKSKLQRAKEKIKQNYKGGVYSESKI